MAEDLGKRPYPLGYKRCEMCSQPKPKEDLVELKFPDMGITLLVCPGCNDRLLQKRVMK